MAKDEQKPAELTTTGTPMTQEQFLAAIRELVQAQQLDAQAIASIAAKAAGDVFEKTNGQFWDIRNYPGVSVFNPDGEKNHPRPEINGEVFWLGYLLHKDEQTREEIELINQIQPGIYNGAGAEPHSPWLVMNLLPGVQGKRKLLVLFPCKDETDRANLPNRRARGGDTAMCDMLREMTGVATAAVA